MARHLEGGQDYHKIITEYQQQPALTVIDKISTKNEISLELIMSQVEIEMDNLKKDLNQKFVSKDAIETIEYQNKRKLGDLERLINLTRDELTLQKNMLQ